MLMMAQQKMLNLPPELLTNVLSNLKVDDVIAFSRTCRRAHDFVEPDHSALWRSIFLNSYDNPEDRWATQLPTVRKADKAVVESWDWFIHLRDRESTIRRILADEPLEMTADYTQAVKVLLEIVETARVRPSSAELAQGVVPVIDDRQSLNLDILAAISNRGASNLDRVIHARQMEALARIPSRRSSGRPVTRSTTTNIEQSEEAARLHLLHGMTKMEKDAPRLRGIARRLVYDWSLTGPTTDYGPFKIDGSGELNWQLLEGLCGTISRNFFRCADGRIVMPEGFHYSVPYRIPQSPICLDDWAGAQASWIGTYAFLDYADLYSFNVGHRPGQRPSLEDEPEACGDLMKLDLRLDPSLKGDPRLKTNLPICNDLPMLYFNGESKGHDGAYRPSIRVRGTVSLVPGGREVRWRFLINYAGEDQWQLEGVQPGGIRSGGVYGLWSHCAHAENGPVGPFCYFPSELCKTTELATIPQ